MKLVKKLGLLAAGLALTTALVACGNNDKKEESAKSKDDEFTLTVWTHPFVGTELKAEQTEVFDKMAEEVQEWEEYKAEDAEILVIAHGIVARSARTAIDELREKGIKAGLFRPITIRPLAVKPLREAVSRAKQVLFTESANGQLAQMVLEKLYGLTTPYQTLFKMGVGVTGDDIVAKVESMLVVA